MATTDGSSPVSLAQRLIQKPYRFEFLQAIGILERIQPKAISLARGNDPRLEALRLKGPLTPVFSSNEIERLDTKSEAKPVLHSPIFGLGGPDGPLPYAYQEWLQQRAKAKDWAASEFLDLFQHRLLSLLYRSLCKHRMALPFMPPEHSSVHNPIRALVGLLPEPLQERQGLPDGALLARAALLTGKRRSLAGFAVLVRHYFGISATVKGFEGAWRSIPLSSRSVAGRKGRNFTLGQTTVAGSRIWDEHAGIRLGLRLHDRTQVQAFLPTGPAHRQLKALLAFYFGPDLDCTLDIAVRGGYPLHLGRAHPIKVGQGAWLDRGPSEQERLIRLRLSREGS
ncbi:type VI secretion system baseplate subunit TssG [Pseudomonas sp. JZ134]|uniref:type VI secretion system baseplate subunit TssG n=1 Tax=Pseudomonas sp. JZ134 TaxID=2806615 RepID=UPI003D9FBEFF